MCVFESNFMNRTLWLIRKKSIKSHIDPKTGDKMYDLPIMHLDRADRKPKYWDPYASRQLVNYVSGKKIEKLTQSYSQRQYDQIKKRAITVSDSEGHDYYLFTASAFPQYRLVKDDAMKAAMIKIDQNKGRKVGNYMTPAEYDEAVFKKGFRGDIPLIVNVPDFDYEVYPDNYPVVYMYDTAAENYYRLPRELKLTVDAVREYNKKDQSYGMKSYYFKTFESASSSSFTTDIKPRTKKRAKEDIAYCLKYDVGINITDLPQAITKLNKSIMPLHLKFIEECRKNKDPNYIPQAIITSVDDLIDESTKGDSPFDFTW